MIRDLWESLYQLSSMYPKAGSLTEVTSPSSQYWPADLLTQQALRSLATQAPYCASDD